MRKKFNINKTLLRKEYIKNRKSTPQIAKETGYVSSTIYKYLKIYNISTRTISEANKGLKFSEKTKKKMKEKAKKRFKNIKNHPHYIDGKNRLGGYILIRVPNHPFTNSNKYILEHRLVIEAYLNKTSFKKWIEYGRKGNYPKKVRFLTKKEIIHHINGIRDDNRLKNLMLFPNSKAHHQFRHLNKKTFICKFCKRNQN
jgi:hypothetical protein